MTVVVRTEGGEQQCSQQPPLPSDRFTLVGATSCGWYSAQCTKACIDQDLGMSIPTSTYIPIDHSAWPEAGEMEEVTGGPEEGRD